MRFWCFSLFLIVFGVFYSCTDHKKSAQKHFVSQSIPKAQDIKQILPQKSQLEEQFEKRGLVDVCKLDSTIHLDLRYAGRNNFTKIILYDTLTRIYLQPDVARKLIKAQRQLKSTNPSLSLIVWDAARPLSVQRKMYEQVSGTVYQNYVASPHKTGLHNYGCAVDLGICRAQGDSLLDMGTPFDFLARRPE